MNKKILVLIKNLDGGTGTFLSQIQLLKDYNFSILAIEKPRYGSFKKGISFFNASPSYVGFYGFNLFVYIDVIREILWVRRNIKKLNPDVLISIDTHCNIVASIALTSRRQTRLIITIHNNISEVIYRKINPLIRPVLRVTGGIFFRRANLVICASRGIGKDFSKLFFINKKIKVVPYGIDINKARKKSLKAPSKKYKKLMNGRFKKIISIGRFEQQKDFLTLIKVFESIHKKNSKVKLFLVGDGTERKMLEEYVEKSHLEDFVLFLGWQKNVYWLLKNSDLFILSSRYEGLGYVILEAMTVSLPIISTNSPFGPAEILNYGEYGKLVPVGSIKKLTSAINSMLSTSKIYNKYSLLSKERIQKYSLDRMLESYDYLIKRI